MANRTLVNSYLRSARAAHPESNVARLAYLGAEAAKLDAAIQSGDWEVTSAGFSGASSTSQRNLSATERVAAIEEAIRLLEDNPEARRRGAGPLLVRFPDLYRPD